LQHPDRSEVIYFSNVRKLSLPSLLIPTTPNLNPVFKGEQLFLPVRSIMGGCNPPSGYFSIVHIQSFQTLIDRVSKRLKAGK